jgi:hypothetical protein
VRCRRERLLEKEVESGWLRVEGIAGGWARSGERETLKAMRSVPEGTKLGTLCRAVESVLIWILDAGRDAVRCAEDGSVSKAGIKTTMGMPY